MLPAAAESVVENQGHWLRRFFPTCHRKLLARTIALRSPLLRGDCLVIGAGSVRPFRQSGPTTSLISLDIDPQLRSIDVRADAHQLPLAPQVFDTVLAIEVIEHLADPSLCLAEVRRVLRPGGILVASVPFMFRIHGHPSDFARYTLEGLHRLFADFAGGVDIAPYGNRLHVLSDLLTTAGRPLVALRVLNHLLCWKFLSGTASADAPSGYVVVATN